MQLYVLYLCTVGVRDSKVVKNSGRPAAISNLVHMKRALFEPRSHPISGASTRYGE